MSTPITKKFGLLGKTLTHSFSKKYFTEKFQTLGLVDHSYDLFEIAAISDFQPLLQANPLLVGMNVTIPYKEQVIPYLTHLDESAQKVGAVNVIKFNSDGSKIGFNSDYFGFLTSLVHVAKTTGFDLKEKKALILGTGGASKAVIAALDHLNVPHASVSREKNKTTFTYGDLTKTIMEENLLVINTTPLGTFPAVNECADVPYHYLTDRHFLFDLVYNPSETLFMKRGIEKGAIVANGLEMLELQAEKAWEIWNA